MVTRRGGNISSISSFIYIGILIWGKLNVGFGGASSLLHSRLRGFAAPNRNTNNARGQMTPQWRLSLKDLGQSGNGALARQNNARNHLWGDDGTQVRLSWAQVTKQQRRGDGNASATEMRQQRIHAAEKTRSQRPDRIPVRFFAQIRGGQGACDARAPTRAATIEQ